MNESKLVYNTKILADRKGGSSLTRNINYPIKSLSKPFQRLPRVLRQPRFSRQQLYLCQELVKKEVHLNVKRLQR